MGIGRLFPGWQLPQKPDRFLQCMLVLQLYQQKNYWTSSWCIVARMLLWLRLGMEPGLGFLWGRAMEKGKELLHFFKCREILFSCSLWLCIWKPSDRDSWKLHKYLAQKASESCSWLQAWAGNMETILLRSWLAAISAHKLGGASARISPCLQQVCHNDQSHSEWVIRYHYPCLTWMM